MIFLLICHVREHLVPLFYPPPGRQVIGNWAWTAACSFQRGDGGRWKERKSTAFSRCIYLCRIHEGLHESLFSGYWIPYWNNTVPSDNKQKLQETVHSSLGFNEKHNPSCWRVEGDREVPAWEEKQALLLTLTMVLSSLLLAVWNPYSFMLKIYLFPKFLSSYPFSTVPCSNLWTLGFFSDI